MKKKVLLGLLLGVLFVFAVGFIGYNRIDGIYRIAIESYKKGDYKESKQLFNEVEWYRNSNEWIKSCDIEIRNKDYLKAKELMKEEKYEEVCKITVKYSSSDKEMDILKIQANEELNREKRRQAAKQEKEQKENRIKELATLTEPYINMSRDELIEVFGKPKKINKTVTKYGTDEQFVYEGCWAWDKNGKNGAYFEGGYVYVEDGVVTSYQGSSFRNLYR